MKTTKLAAAAALFALNPFVLKGYDKLLPAETGKKQRGFRLGAGVEPGEVFQDSRGQSYVKDNKGTIRRTSSL